MTFAYKLYQDQKFVASKILFEALSILVPTEAYNYNMRGACELKLSNDTAALENFELAISHEPLYWTAHLNQAEMLMRTMSRLGDVDVSCKLVIDNCEDSAEVEKAKNLLTANEHCKDVVKYLSPEQIASTDETNYSAIIESRKNKSQDTEEKIDDWSNVKIFISYRRSDAFHFAEWLENFLETKANCLNVFVDKSDMTVAEDFRIQIRKEIKDSDIFICIIGSKWQQERLAKDDDFVRREIKYALDREMPIVPILYERFSMPDPQDLPMELRNICNIQGVNIYENKKIEASEYLWAALEKIKVKLDARRSWFTGISHREDWYEALGGDHFREYVHQKLERNITYEGDQKSEITSAAFPQYGLWESTFTNDDDLDIKIIYTFLVEKANKFRGKRQVFRKAMSDFSLLDEEDIEGNISIIIVADDKNGELTNVRYFGFQLKFISRGKPDVAHIFMTRKIGDTFWGQFNGWSVCSRNIQPRPGGF